MEQINGDSSLLKLKIHFILEMGLLIPHLVGIKMVEDREIQQALNSDLGPVAREFVESVQCPYP